MAAKPAVRRPRKPKASEPASTQVSMETTPTSDNAE